jgi:hypothetical protein
MDQATPRKRARRVSVANDDCDGIDENSASKKWKRNDTIVLNMDQELFFVIPLANHDESSAPASKKRANGSDSISNDSALSLLPETCRFPTNKLRSSTTPLIKGQYVISPKSSTSSLSSLCMERGTTPSPLLSLPPCAVPPATATTRTTSCDVTTPPLPSVVPIVRSSASAWGACIEDTSYSVPKPVPVSKTEYWLRRRRLLMLLVIVAMVGGVLPRLRFARRATSVANTGYGWFQRSAPEPDSVCVSGGGFSGFWYTLGRLESIPDPSSKKYYCYSAGCLGVVASLSNYTMEQMWDMAHNVQMRWKRGEISRYQVVEAFLDDLLYQPTLLGERNQSRPILATESLQLLNIITTVKNGWFGLTTSVRTPSSVESLRTMLIQTSWIPFAIGDDLWHLEHMDGAFTLPQHPSCAHHVGLSLNWDLYLNVINVNLGRDKVETFWNQGLTRGL